MKTVERESRKQLNAVLLHSIHHSQNVAGSLRGDVNVVSVSMSCRTILLLLKGSTLHTSKASAKPPQIMNRSAKRTNILALAPTPTSPKVSGAHPWNDVTSRRGFRRLLKSLTRVCTLVEGSAERIHPCSARFNTRSFFLSKAQHYLHKQCCGLICPYSVTGTRMEK